MKKPKILVIGKKGGILNWPENVINACKALDLTYGLFPTNHLTGTSRLQSKTTKLLNKKRFIALQAKQLQQQLTEFSPGFIFFIDSLGLSSELINVIEKNKNKFHTAHWVGDHYSDSICDLNPITDRFYFTDSSMLGHANTLNLNQPGVLGLAVDENIFHRKLDKNNNKKQFFSRKKEVLFIGAYSENRREIIENIDTSIHIYGKGWDKLKTRKHHVHPKNISLKKVAKLNQQHQIILNIINSNNITNGLNMRCFEATASGAALLTDNVKDLPYYFSNKEVISYANSDDLNNQLEKVYRDPVQLYQIARNGQKKTIARHTYKKRLLKVIEDFN